MPYLKEAYYGELERKTGVSIPVAQLDSYKGLCFATFDPEAPPLREYLGEMTWYLDTFFDRREGGIEVVGGLHKWVMPCNWKFPAENFGGDAYHVQWSHLSAIKTGFSVGVTANPTRQSMVSPGNGHALICVGPERLVGDPPMPEIQAYEKEIAPEVQQRLGPRAGLINPIVGTVFPNFSMLRGHVAHLRVWHPRGPDKTEVWSWVYVDKAAPPRGQGAVPHWPASAASAPPAPSSRTTWTTGRNARATCRGVVSRRMPLNTQMGLGHERFDDDARRLGQRFPLQREQPSPVLRRWLQLMTTQSWSHQ